MSSIGTLRDGEGRVFFEGELWMTVSGDPLGPGDKAVVQKLEGLVLKIASSKDDVAFHA
jgi:membrane protein implicated in regulation of membrane protease activity